MSTQVDRILDEIAQLSTEEQRELRQALPRVLGEHADDGELDRAALERVLANRERIRVRLLTEG